MGSISYSQYKDLHTILKDAHHQFIQANPLSKEGHDKRCSSMPGGNTRTVLYTTPIPRTFSSASSCHLTSADGHEYIDFLGEYTAGIYGHNNPIIRKAIDHALDSGWNYGGHSDMEGELAALVCTRFPAIELVRFVNSGTEANMMALATAVAFTGKKKILIFEGGYHGSTITTEHPPHHGGPPSKPSIRLPHDFIVGKYNDVHGTRELVDSLPPNSLAAILVEPMLGSGGCFTATHDFLTLLRSQATHHNALLIFDEVMTSRLSHQGYAAKLGVQPDLMTLGKWVGGGMSFGAFGGRAGIMRMYDPSSKDALPHPGTFNNNVFSMSAGIAGCNLLDESRINALNDLGDRMRIAVEGVLHKHEIHGVVPSAPVIATVATMTTASSITKTTNGSSRNQAQPPKMFIKGVGSIMTIHFSGPEKEVLQGLFFHHLLARRIYIAQRGFMALSIEIKQSHVDRFVDCVEEFVTLYHENLV